MYAACSNGFHNPRIYFPFLEINVLSFNGLIIIIIMMFNVFYSANQHMNMIKCTLQFYGKSNQHCPNHYFTIIIIIHRSNQFKSNQMLVFDESTTGKTSHGRVQKYRTSKLNPVMTPSAEIKLRPHWWKASALATKPTHHSLSFM